MQDATIRGSAVLSVWDDLIFAAVWAKFALVVVFIVAWVNLLGADISSSAAIFLSLATTGILGLAMALGIGVRFLLMSNDRKSMTYLADQEGLTIQNGAGAISKVPWTTVHKAKRRFGLLQIKIRSAGRLYVPLRAFEPSDRTRLLAWATRRPA